MLKYRFGWLIPMVIVIAFLGIAAFSGCPSKGNRNSAASSNGENASQSDNGDRSRFSQFQDEHKYTFQLMRMAQNIGRLEKDGVAPLTVAQAKFILAVLNPLRKKATLTQDEAKEALKGLKKVLNEQQLTELGKMQATGRQRGGTRGDRPQGNGPQRNRPGGNTQRPQGNRPRMDPEAMRDFNPFNPTKDSPMAGRGGRGMKDLFDMLEKKAKG